MKTTDTNFRKERTSEQTKLQLYDECWIRASKCNQLQCESLRRWCFSNWFSLFTWFCFYDISGFGGWMITKWDFAAWWIRRSMKIFEHRRAFRRLHQSCICNDNIFQFSRAEFVSGIAAPLEWCVCVLILSSSVECFAAHKRIYQWRNKMPWHCVLFGSQCLIILGHFSIPWEIHASSRQTFSTAFFTFHTLQIHFFEYCAWRQQWKKFAKSNRSASRERKLRCLRSPVCQRIRQTPLVQILSLRNGFAASAHQSKWKK